MAILELQEMQREDAAGWSRRSVSLLAWTAIVIPPICFYLLLSKSLSSLPFLDDYPSVLSFLLAWRQEHGLQHIGQILTAQHNEYRLMFENAIFGAQYSMLGHTNIKALSVLGDLFVLPMLGVLYLIWRKHDSSRNAVLLTFVPVSWLLFQLQYASTLNCAMMPLQHFPVIVFSILSCYFASKETRTAFCLSLCCLMLSIASSGSGLFLIPIGCVMLLQRKEYPRLAIWTAAAAVMCFIYFHGYNFHASATHADHNLLSSVRHISLVYAAVFLGSIATATNPVPAVLLSILLLTAFLFATRERVFESNPSLYYSMLFFFVTALGVSGLRSDSELSTALGSHYRINSTVIVILTYLYLVDKYRAGAFMWKWPMAVSAICVVGVVLAGFEFASDRAGYKLLLTRREKLGAAMLRWERHEPRPPIGVLAADDYTSRSEEKGWFEPAGPILSDAIQAGIYQLPQLPEGH